MAKTVGLVKDTYNNWKEDDVTNYSAALAYYAIFSVAPLLLIVIFIAGLVYGQGAAQEQLLGQVRQAVGNDAANFVGRMIQQANKPGAGTVASVIGIVTLLLGATRIFTQLKYMLNKIWGVEAPSGFVQGFLKGKLLAFLMVLGLGILFLALTVAATVVSAMIGYLSERIGGAPWMWELANVAIAVLIFTLLFAMIYKFLPDLKIPWSDVWVGSLVTAVLFVIGKVLLGLYLSRGTVASPYGAAGSLVVLLVFFYYAALIFFTGAEFTETYARKYGSRRAEGLNERVRKPAGEARERQEEEEMLEFTPRRLPAYPQVTGGKMFVGLATFLAWRRLLGR